MILICSIPLTSVLHLQCLAPPSHHTAQQQRLEKTDFYRKRLKKSGSVLVQRSTVLCTCAGMPPACPKIYILRANFSVIFNTANDGKMTNLPNTPGKGSLPGVKSQMLLNKTIKGKV